MQILQILYNLRDKLHVELQYDIEFSELNIIDVLNYSITLTNYFDILKRDTPKDDLLKLFFDIVIDLIKIKENFVKLMIEEDKINYKIISTIDRNLNKLAHDDMFKNLAKDTILTKEEVKENELIYALWKESNLIQVIRDRLINSHDLFTKFIAYELEGNYIESPFDKVFNDTIDEVFKGNIKRLIINIPMGYGKTFRATIVTALRSLAIEARGKILHISYDNTLVQLNSQTIRGVIKDSYLFKKIFGIKLIDDTKAKGLWKTSKNGIFRAVSSGSGITGFRAGNINIDGHSGLMIIDDPLKPDDALSNTKRQFINARFENVFKSRLAYEDVPIIVIMQRLHKEDFTNHLISNYPLEWTLLKIPALYDGYKPNENAININTKKFFKVDKSTWEIKYPTEYLLKDKLINPTYFYTQLQQEPILNNANKIFNPKWIKQSDISFDDSQFSKLAIVADTANTKNTYSDYTAIFAVGIRRSDKKLIILDIKHEKLEFDELLYEFRQFYKYWRQRVRLYPKVFPNISEVLIENKSSGISLIQILQKKGYPVVPINRTKDKVYRASNIVPFLANSICEYDKMCQWKVRDLFKEMEEFSYDDSHKHDDLIDCLIDSVQYVWLPLNNEVDIYDEINIIEF